MNIVSLLARSEKLRDHNDLARVDLPLWIYDSRSRGFTPDFHFSANKNRDLHTSHPPLEFFAVVEPFLLYIANEVS